MAVIVVAACGSSSSKGGSSPGASSAPSSSGVDTAVLGTPKKATGTPIKVGFADDGASGTIDTTSMEPAVKALAQYANDYLGGIGGHPITLDICQTKNNPSTAQSCGNQFVADKVSVVNAASLGQTEPVFKALAAANIPFVDALNSDQAVLTSKTGFSVSNPLNAFGGAAIYAKENGIKHVAFLVIDVPSASGPAKALAPILFKNAGATVDVVAIPPGTADMTPQIQAEQAKNPGQYHLLGDPSFCGAALKAIKTLGIKAKITGIDRCIDGKTAASIPGGYSGLTAFTPVSTDTSSADWKLYNAVTQKYTGKAADNKDTQAATAYQGMLATIKALNAANITDVSAAGVMAAIKAAPPTQIPLGEGGTFQCNGKALSLAAGVCGSSGISGDAAQDGSLSNFKLLNDPTIYKLG
jgi:ABC-type branched-subunit amino acid transport system substrate-binding protein